MVKEVIYPVVNETTLKAIVQKRGAIAPGGVLHVLLQMCDGLGYAHDMVSPDDGHPLGIVHRDVSPPNILISKNGEVKIVDFGLAHLDQPGPSMTMTGDFSAKAWAVVLTTFRPPMDASLPGASVSFAVISSPASSSTSARARSAW